MQQNLIQEIYNELDMLRVLSKLANYALINDAKDINEDCYILTFKDIENRYWRITELLELLENGL